MCSSCNKRSYKFCWWWRWWFVDEKGTGSNYGHCESESGGIKFVWSETTVYIKLNSASTEFKKRRYKHKIARSSRTDMNWTEFLFFKMFKISQLSKTVRKVGRKCVSAIICRQSSSDKPKVHLARHVTSQHNTTRWTCRACRAVLFE